jgi:hypothetical protein
MAGASVQTFSWKTRREEITWNTRLTWDHNIKNDLEEIGCDDVDWIQLAQRDQ